MHIKDNMFRSFNHFNLDMDSIGSTSIKRNEIRLPYTGELPSRYDTAYLFVRVAPGDVRLVIVARLGEKETRYIIEATPEEISNILWQFFFRETRPGTYATRVGAGLSDYSSTSLDALEELELPDFPELLPLGTDTLISGTLTSMEPISACACFR